MSASANELDVEKSFASIAGPLEIDLAETAAPAFQPEHQVFLLFVRPLEMDKHVDIACRAGRCILRAANQVNRLYSGLLVDRSAPQSLAPCGNASANAPRRSDQPLRSLISVWPSVWRDDDRKATA